jgi:two-component system chemotaxis response regulator CheB
MTLALATTLPVVTGRRVRVMIVDDAVVVRCMLTRWVEAEADMDVVASLRTGREAIDQIECADPDVVVLDIDMPEMDGIEALPLLLAKKRDLIVIMASTLTRRNAEISLKALALGAVDYIPKPSSDRAVSGSLEFHRDLIEKIRQLGPRARRMRPFKTSAAEAQWGSNGLIGGQPGAQANGNASLRARTPLGASSDRVAVNSSANSPDGAAIKAATPTHQTVHAPIVLRPMPTIVPSVLAIGASTGGPQALNTLMARIGGLIDRSPVLITQHMPPTFTAILAEHLARVAGRPAREAQDGEEIRAGTIYLAPGGKHMRVSRRNGTAVIEIDNGPAVNFCKPAVDPLFASAAEIWGNKVLGLVLTGMGCDGLGGSRAIVAAGGHVLAQDEASSVVWGMPGQVALAGLCSAVLPLDDMASKLVRAFAGDHA